MAIKNTVSQIELEIPDDTPEFYSNFLQVFITQWDFLLVLGSTHMVTDEDRKLAPPPAKADVLIRMSPQHAKATLGILGGLVARFEESNGPIGLAKEEADDGDSKSISSGAEAPRAQRRRNTGQV